LITVRDPGLRPQHHIDQVTDTVRVKRFAGHEPPVEDRAEKRLRRKLRVDRRTELSLSRAPHDEAGQRLAAERRVAVAEFPQPRVALSAFDEGGNATDRVDPP
jgi:hypothetical protein